MKRFAMATAVAFFCVFASTAAADTRFQDQVIKPVVQLNKDCSAALIYSGPKRRGGENRTILLTAKHCVERRAQLTQVVYIPVYQGNRLVSEMAMRARVVSRDWVADLAVLELLDNQIVIDTLVTLAPADVALTEGEPVWTVGYSRGYSRAVTDGRFGNRESIPFPSRTRDTEYFRASPQIAGGNSGGMLFHRTSEGDYRVIGVTAAGIPASDFIGYYVPIDQIERFLKRVVPELYRSEEGAGDQG